MAMNTYVADIRLPQGGIARVMVQANSSSHAKQLLELQYGKDRVINLHQR